MSPRTRTAYHEAGHVVLSAAINDTPRHVSIRPNADTRGRTGMKRASRPSSLAQVALAGFAAEHLFTGRRSRHADREIGFAILTHFDPELGAAFVGVEHCDGHLAVQHVLQTGILVFVDCAELSESLLETELFGHEKGAFTGAVSAKAGLLEAADGGSVFFDEIGELPPSLQGKLLRVLEKRETRRLGALHAKAIDVRFLAATNRDLLHEVSAARFRRDLYYRLSGVVLTLAPLRERAGEIEPLARTFAAQMAAGSGRPAPRFSSDAIDALKAHDWPGNVRELRQVVERAVLLSSGDLIARDHLHLRHAKDDAFPLGEAATRPSASLVPPRPASGDERDRVVDALARSGGNQRKAAKLLGISRGTMAKRLADHRIPRPRKPH